MNKKINTQVGTILISFFAVVLIGYVFFQLWQYENEESKFFSGINKLESESPILKKNVGTSRNFFGRCTAGVFKGDANVRVWNAESPDDFSIVQVKDEDVLKLPVPFNISNETKTNFKIRIIDASQEIFDSIRKSTKENPIEINLKGYKTQCYEMPQVIPMASSSFSEEKFFSL